MTCLRALRSSARLGGALLAWAALAVLSVTPARAQGALADSAAWEPLGDEPLQISALGFTGPPEGLTDWALDRGIYRLDAPPDGSFERIDIGPGRGQIHFFGPDPLRPDTVFAGRGLHRSVDGGATFERIDDPVGGEGGFIGNRGALARFPPDSPYPHRLVVDDFLVGDPADLVYSDDGGDSWTRADASPVHEPFHVAAFRSGRAVSAGFYGAALSDDGGVTWQHIPALYDTTRIRYDLHQMLLLPGFVTGKTSDSTEGRLLVAGGEASETTHLVSPNVTAGLSTDAPTSDVPGLSTPVPNPSRRSASLTLTLPDAATAEVALYDVLGRRVAVLLAGDHKAGTHRLDVGTAGRPAGVYVVRAVVRPVEGGAVKTLTRRLTIAR